MITRLRSLKDSKSHTFQLLSAITNEDGPSLVFYFDGEEVMRWFNNGLISMSDQYALDDIWEGFWEAVSLLYPRPQ